MRIDREMMIKALQYKKQKQNNNFAEPQNPNNLLRSEKNNTEVSKGYMEKFPQFPHKNNSSGKRNYNCGNCGNSDYSTSKTSVEKSEENSEETEIKVSAQKETEDEEIEIKDNTIVIKAKDRHRFEINYGFVGTVEDMTRIKDLKIPLLPQYEFVTKRKDGETLSVIVTVDFYEKEGGGYVYYIRNRKELVEKLYKFKADKKITQRLIGEALDTWLEHIEPEKRIQWTDVTEAVKKYKEWEEINNDPIQFFLDQSSDVVGNEKLKIAVLLSVVSSQLTKLKRGIYRVHLILTGSSGAGKSSTIKSILDLFYNNMDGFKDWIVLNITRLTKEALGRLDINTMDGKVFFIEQLDNAEGVDYVREAMSEGYISTLTTVKDENGNLVTKTIIIPGQPAFISTNVSANVDHQIVNRSIQLYLSPAEDDMLKLRIMKAILYRDEDNEEDINRLKLITYVWLKTRPRSPKLTEDVGDSIIKILSKFINFRNINRATEITRNLVRATASLFGREQITREDLDFVMRYFKKDIILTTLELSERDLQLLRWMRDHGFVQAEKDDETRDISTAEIAQVAKMSTQETKKILDSLYDKGLLWKAYDGKKFTWAVSHYGVKVLTELEREVEEEQSEEGEDVLIDDQLLAIITSKLMSKKTVKEEELRGILERVAQTTDLEVQDLFIKALEKKGIIKSEGDGLWEVKL